MVAASPSPGWRFDHWEGGATSAENPLKLVLEKDPARRYQSASAFTETCRN